MKLKIAPGRMIVTFIVSSLVMGVALFGIGFNMFIKWPWDWPAYALAGFWIASSILFLVLTLTQNYYVLNKKYVTVKRFNKVAEYNFADVIYIDEEKSKKKKVIYFFLKDGQEKYLTFDSKGMLYKTMIERCTNRLSKEDFYRTHPNVQP